MTSSSHLLKLECIVDRIQQTLIHSEHSAGRVDFINTKEGIIQTLESTCKANGFAFTTDKWKQGTYLEAFFTYPYTIQKNNMKLHASILPTTGVVGVEIIIITDKNNPALRHFFQTPISKTDLQTTIDGWFSAYFMKWANTW